MDRVGTGHMLDIDLLSSTTARRYCIFCSCPKVGFAPFNAATSWSSLACAPGLRDKLNKTLAIILDVAYVPPPNIDIARARRYGLLGRFRSIS